MSNDFTQFAFNGAVQVRDPGAHAADTRGYNHGHANGMTKREYYAGISLQVVGTLLKGVDIVEASDLAKQAVELADALMKELENGNR